MASQKSNYVTPEDQQFKKDHSVSDDWDVVIINKDHTVKTLLNFVKKKGPQAVEHQAAEGYIILWGKKEFERKPEVGRQAAANKKWNKEQEEKANQERWLTQQRTVITFWVDDPVKTMDAAYNIPSQFVKDLIKDEDLQTIRDYYQGGAINFRKQYEAAQARADRLKSLAEKYGD